nr:UvrD-helicase domain-containing protein [Clostridia bacterium]
DIADAYSSLKRKDNKMDFADLEYYAVKLLRNDEMANEISRKYDYVCVDEYQDVNAVQEYILNRVSNGKNLFMVGDVKQSIYQFRMTDPDIFLKKYKSYRENSNLGSPHSLNKNYRSGREVIDFVNAVFNNIMTEETGGVDYRRDSQLSLGNTDYEEQRDDPVRITSFSKSRSELDAPIGADGVYSVRDSLALEKDNVYAEGVYIAERIAALVGREKIQVSSDGKMVYRPVKFSDIAILCPKRSDGVEKIVNVLKSVGIPVDSANIVNEKFNPCVALIVDFIKVLDNHRQDIPLTAILTSKVFSSLSYSDMAQIKKQYREEKFFCDGVEKYAKEKTDGIALELAKFFSMLDKYRFAAGFMSVSNLIRRIMADFDLRSFAIAAYGGESAYAGLERIVGKLEGKPYNSSIAKFTEAAENADDFGSVSGDTSVQGDFVKTSTIHASKGLEYPIVFLVDLAKQVNMTDITSAPVVYDKRYGFAIRNINDLERSYDDSLPMELIKVAKSKDIIEEYMRLFYVAVTRARNKLYLTATSSGEFGEKYVNKPKSMWDWLNNVAFEEPSFMDKYYFHPEDLECENAIEEYKDTARLSVDAERIKEFEKMLTKEYAYSQATKTLVKYTVTSVNNEYYESRYEKGGVLTDSESLVELAKNSDSEEKEELSACADEGIAYHRVLECIDYDCYTLTDVENNIASMIEQGLLTEEQRKAVDGASVLECLQSQVMSQARKYPHYREKQFMLNLPADEILDTTIKDKVLLQGTIDLFINGRAQGGENILVDFKFSSKSVNAIKERYRRQLELYARAIEECLGEKVDKRIIFVLGRNIEITV